MGGAAPGFEEFGGIMDGEVGESALNTLWLNISKIRLKWLRKPAPGIGIATRVS